MQGRAENCLETGPLGGDNEITRGFGFDHLMLSHKRQYFKKLENS